MTHLPRPYRLPTSSSPPATPAQLAGQFGVAYSLNGVYDLMKRLGMVWISARAVSPYADPVAQAEFKKKLRPGSRGNAAARNCA